MSRSRAMKRNAKPSRRKQGKTAPRTGLCSGRLPVAKELIAAGAPLDADVEMERQRRMEALKALLLQQMAAGRGAEAIDHVLGSMMALERENERLAWRVLRANRFRFGRSSEKLSTEELGQLFLALGGERSALQDSSAETQSVPAPAEPEQVETSTTEASDSKDTGTAPPPKRKKRRRVQQMQVDPSVERNIQLAALTDTERCCSLCGGEKKVFDHVEHELIRFVPAKIVVDVERREKGGCPRCRQEVSVAPRQEQPSVVRRVDASLLAKLVADKTSLALPVERQRRQLQGLGLQVPAKTLASYWAYTLDLIEPVAVATLSAVFGDEIVGLDDSHLKTLDKSSKNGVFRGHLWCFVGTDSARRGGERVGYGYTQSWEAAEIADWLGVIDGFMQGDGYAGYSTELEDEETGETFVLLPDERRLGCGMHIRSKFHDALLAQDKRAAVPLQHFADLYVIEADCKERGLDALARAEQRRRRSLPLLDALDHWVDDLHPKLLPKSPLRRATTYAINQRAFFRRCFEDGRFEIDNGRVERRIRNFAVGRRNYLFTGSARGGERLAAAYTLVDNCTLLGINPYQYLLDVIRKLDAGWPMRRLSELIPWNWAASNQTG
jgi:transposase